MADKKALKAGGGNALAAVNPGREDLVVGGGTGNLAYRDFLEENMGYTVGANGFIGEFTDQHNACTDMGSVKTSSDGKTVYHKSDGKDVGDVYVTKLKSSGEGNATRTRAMCYVVPPKRSDFGGAGDQRDQAFLDAVKATSKRTMEVLAAYNKQNPDDEIKAFRVNYFSSGSYSGVGTTKVDSARIREANLQGIKEALDADADKKLANIALEFPEGEGSKESVRNVFGHRGMKGKFKKAATEIIKRRAELRQQFQDVSRQLIDEVESQVALKLQTAVNPFEDDPIVHRDKKYIYRGRWESDDSVRGIQIPIKDSKSASIAVGKFNKGDGKIVDGISYEKGKLQVFKSGKKQKREMFPVGLTIQSVKALYPLQSALLNNINETLLEEFLKRSNFSSNPLTPFDELFSDETLFGLSQMSIAHDKKQELDTKKLESTGRLAETAVVAEGAANATEGGFEVLKLIGGFFAFCLGIDVD
ncbi:hypothetical protein DID78_03930 [Candidatus Marinamargulisbacteria bacterium SCGC AG-343-D04]|nr:hypothetical protein DID78_03930 [Candidatus Marinamargulisbacteria bacterium SCGC AG-343-D04]